MRIGVMAMIVPVRVTMGVVMTVLVPVFMAMPVCVIMIVSMAVAMFMVVLMLMPMPMLMLMRVRRSGADALDVMMMALLGQADLGLEAENLLAVLAHLAVHQVGTGEYFRQPVGKGVEYERVVVEIGRLDELDIGVRGGHGIGVVIDALDKDAGEQEVRKNDDAPIPQLCRMFEARCDQRKGDAGIARLAPAEAHTFPQHPAHLGDVGIGVGVRRAAADDHEQGVVIGNLAELGIGGGDRLADPVTGGADHLQIDAEFAAIENFGIGMLRRIGVEDGRNVVLGMACREQHAGHGENTPRAALTQRVKTVADNWPGKFKETVLDVAVGETGPQGRCDLREFAHRIDIPAAVSAHHDGVVVVHFSVHARQ